MMRPAILTIVSLATLSACAAAAAPPRAEFLAAVLLADRPAAQAIEAATAAAPLRKAVAPGGKSSRRQRARLGASPLARVEAANGAAVREPAAAGYVGAVQVYPWAEGALYRLYTAPGEVSDIALQPGESLVSVAAGDTVRWVIGDTASGTGAARRTHILVKPSAAGLRTNLVIATDRRVYHVEAESHAKTAMASIAWTYPDDALLALSGTAPAPVAAGVAVDSLNFNYRIEGDNPPWRPVRAFDDGRQVFIEFPPAFGQGEAPPLFVVGDKGRAELVNYRIRGRFYVVDRLFAAAELRLGERRQQIVRIVSDRRRSR
jgi:type IV secretion system protein VirB9